MKIVAMIPARYLASRFPGKLMALIGSEPVIVHTYRNTVKTNLFSEVIVVTDHQMIYDTIKDIGGNVVMSLKEHESGTDRIAEVAENIDADVIVNVQGDEPFVNVNGLEKLCALFNDPITQIGSLKVEITEVDAQNPNVVKVVCDLKGNALYFSRNLIPYKRELSTSVQYYKHIGIYGYRKDILIQIHKLIPSNLEQIEKLEQLRMLENGYKIKLAEVEGWSIAIDTPEDLENAKKII